MDASVRRIGLTEVYKPRNDESHIVDIVLVHGLFGDPKKTWTSEAPTYPSGESGIDEAHTDSDHPPRKKPRTGPRKSLPKVFWPRDLLPKELPNARILTWGYDVQIERMLSETSKASIFQHAETLLSDLALLRGSTLDKGKPLIFIAHSLGGIVVKDALSLSKVETTFFKEILPATRGVVFLGTPHRGSKAASLGKIAFELSRIFLKDPNIKILRALEVGSEILERISRSFGQVLASGHIKVHSFQEELATKGVSIVDASSSTIGYLNESRSTLYANHSDMVKFSSTNDVNFQRVTLVVRRWVDEIDQSRPAVNHSLSLDMENSELPDDLIFDEKYRECMKTLNVVEARTRLETVKPTYKDTYTWLFDPNIGFRSWLEGKNSAPIYWIRGKPGSGKSTLMKFALTHSLTPELLQNYSNRPWVITGYFFHDRGTRAQKSIRGFLCEILYQILRNRRNLFQLVYPIFSQLSKIMISEFLTAAEESENSTSLWSLGLLREALLSIGSKSTTALNCCLFIDALDEHDGDHRELISILTDLAKSTKNPLFRLRLCLAGRPENIFKNTFRTCPGFAIQDYTTTDIRRYAEDKIREEHFWVLNDKGKQEVYFLVEDMIKKADGVFLWVKLVIHELVEEIYNGHTPEELKNLLSEIPSELEDLYTRAIRRVCGTEESAATKHGYEAYVMFQIAVFARKPLRLEQFVRAAIFLSAGKRSLPDCETQTLNQMECRLNSKSAGLLEASGSREEIVQFIHQTVKMFIITGKGGRAIKESIGDERSESGNLLILRYIISELADNQKFANKEFLHYALAVEIKENEPVGKYLEPAVGSLTESNCILTNIVQPNDASKWLNQIAGIYNGHIVKLLLFYVLCDLPLSLDRYIKSHRREIDADISALLLEAALSLRPGIKGQSPYRSFRVLLEAGIGADIPQYSSDWVDQMLHRHISKAFTKTSAYKKLLYLWTQLRQQRKRD